MNRKIGGGCEVSDTLNIFDNTENRTPILVVEANERNKDIHLADIPRPD